MQEEKKDPTVQTGKKELKKDNLWQKFLNDSLTSGRGAKKEGHLVVLGSANAGKTALISQFKKLESQTNEMKRFLMMRYSYVNLTDANSDESRALLNIWQVSDPSHCKILDVVIPAEHMEHVCWMICLNASEPATVQEEYNKWLAALQETQTRLLGRLHAQAQGKLKDKLTTHIQHYQNPNDAEAEPFEEDEKDTVALSGEKLETNLGCPIIIVATKCDMFRRHYVAESEADDHFEILLSYLRWWSLKYGMSTFTMAKGMKEQARRILQYIDHRMFDSSFNRGPNAVVKLSNLQDQFLFIPSGFDTKNTIESQFPDRKMDDPISGHFKSKKQDKKASSEQLSLRSQADETFLKTLEFELNNAQGGKGGDAARGKGGGGGAGGANAQRAAVAQRAGAGAGGGAAGGAAKAGAADGGNAVVQRFFNSILVKDTVQTPGQS